jgi:ABC-type polysaccharide/polyol phosphate export permease
VKRFDREYRELLAEMTKAEWKRANQRSFLGVAWALLGPLLMAAVLYAVFRLRFGRDVESYPIYLLVGMVLYTHFANTTGAALTVLRSMKSLTIATTFPKEIMVIATVLSRTLDLALMLSFCVAVARVAGHPLGIELSALPVIFVLESLLALWVSLLLSVSYVFVRDVLPVYQVFLRILFVVTPIFYTPHLLGGGAGRRLIDWNPLATVIGMGRQVLLDGRVPDPLHAGVFFVVQAALVASTLIAFRRLEPGIAERV